jgi:hypothetical protein
MTNEQWLTVIGIVGAGFASYYGALTAIKVQLAEAVLTAKSALDTANKAHDRIDSMRSNQNQGGF